jgi:hypothetical protein
MIRRGLGVVAWGALGVALAGALIVGAFAVAGTRLTEPATAVRVSGPPLRPEPSRSHDARPSDDGTASTSRSSTATRSPTAGGDDGSATAAPLSPSPSDDDRGGGTERGDD